MRLALTRVGEAMLKISLVDNARQRRVIVEGKLIAPWTTELRNACQEARADLRGRELVIEMKHIATISHGGRDRNPRVDKRGEFDSAATACLQSM